MAGKFCKADIAKRVGCSWSTLSRYSMESGVKFYFFNRYQNNPDLVKRVCRYYEKYGKAKTQEKFPEISVRSIVERYPQFKPRQSRWTDSEIIEAVRMAGIISQSEQAKRFNRPNANRGSIISLWMKKFKMGGGDAQGLSWHVARYFVRPSCPKIKTEFWATRKTAKKSIDGCRTIVLWVDFAKHLKAGQPEWIQSVANALARYQVWIFQTKQVRARVKKYMGE